MRQLAIVGVLLISVVGIPWGVRQLVRYQFAAQVTVLENAGPRLALARSSQLVTGRWFHTAAVVAVLTELAAAFSLVVGLGLLVFISGLPLWLFSAVVSLFTMFVVPYTAIALVLLYGDARAAVTEAAGSSAGEPGMGLDG